MVILITFEEKKEQLSEKIDEKKTNAKNKVHETQANILKKKISCQMNRAEKKIDKAIEEADKNICKLLKCTNKEIEKGDSPVDLIMFKSSNQFEEIRLEAELKMQQAKVELIKSLENDVDKLEHLSNIESDTAEVKDKFAKKNVKLKIKLNAEKQKLRKNLTTMKLLNKNNHIF